MRKHSQEIPKGDNTSPNGPRQVSGRETTGLAERIQYAAKVQQLSMAKLAHGLGLTRGTLARYWHGERLPPADTLFALADQLGVDARWLVTGQRHVTFAEEAAEFELLYTRLNTQQRAHIVKTMSILLGIQTPNLDDEHIPSYGTLHSPRLGYEAEPKD